MIHTNSQDGIFAEALRYLFRDGWPTREEDQRIADGLYIQWVAETHVHWCTSGHRDRQQLHNALIETFFTRYGDEGGGARVVVLALLLETRARRAGHTRGTCPAA